MDRPPRFSYRKTFEFWSYLERLYLFRPHRSCSCNVWLFLVLFSGGWYLGQSLSFTDLTRPGSNNHGSVGIVTSQIGNLLGCQTTRTSTFKVGIFKNKWVIRGILFEVAVTLSIVYIPYLQSIFGTTAIGLYQCFTS